MIWRMAMLGALSGAVTATLWFAPARWLGEALASASDARVQLASPQGTVWNGSARLEFTGGALSKDAVALPGRVIWQLRPSWNGINAHVVAPCCAAQGINISATPRWGGALVRVADSTSHWPAGLLSGLGTPWNTLAPQGDLQFSSQGLGFEAVQGRISISGTARIDAQQMSSRLSTLKPMGSYRFSMTGGVVTTFQLETLEGSLRLTGQGQWSGVGTGAKLRFDGAASAEPDREAALANLLNIIGRRDGARSIITVG